MKKFLIFILSLVLLFVVSFSCSYAVYKKTKETSDEKLTIGSITTSSEDTGITNSSSDGDNDISYRSHAGDSNTTNGSSAENIDVYVLDSEENDAAINVLSDNYASDSDSETQTLNRKNYIVREYNGYVAVFTISNSLYEFTDILVEDLDSDLKKRVKNGILFEKEEELYTFLESCSS